MPPKMLEGYDSENTISLGHACTAVARAIARRASANIDISFLADEEVVSDLVYEVHSLLGDVPDATDADIDTRFDAASKNHDEREQQKALKKSAKHEEQLARARQNCSSY